MSEFNSAWSEIKAGLGLFFKILIYSVASLIILGGFAYAVISACI